METLYLEKKYDFPILTKQCQDFLGSSISEDNVCTILNQSSKWDEKNMIEKCKEFIFKHPTKTISSNDFLNIDKLNLINFIQSEEFYCQEELIFEKCISWSKKQTSSFRDAMKDILPHIRFPLMSAHYISTTVKDTNILSEDQFQLLLFVTSNGIAGKIKFFKEPRKKKEDTNRQNHFSERNSHKWNL